MLVQTSTTLWLDGSRTPVRMVTGGERWRVIDTPTPLGNGDFLGSDWVYLLTHPPRWWEGWRFTARSESGETLVFDVGRGEDEREWRVLRRFQ